MLQSGDFKHIQFLIPLLPTHHSCIYIKYLPVQRFGLRSVNFRLLLRVHHVPGSVLRAGGAKMEDAVTGLGIIVLQGTGYVGK